MLALTILLFSAVSFAVPVYSVQDTGVTVGFDVQHGVGDKLLDELIANLTALGFTCVTNAETELDLSTIDVLVLGCVYGGTYSQDFVDDVVAWYDEGGKGIFVGGDSDYGPPQGHQNIMEMNDLLEALGSSLRIEPTSVEDPEVNAQAPYRVVGNVVNTEDEEVQDITTGITQALFHGPSILYGVDADGTPTALEASLDNIYWIMKTSSAGILVDHDTDMPLAHSNGQEGSFVLMAAELVWDKLNKVIVAGASPYGDYQPMCSDEYYDVPLSGMLLVVKSILWLSETLTEPEQPTQPMIPGFPIEAIMIGVAITAAALYIFKREEFSTL